jgi:hypothetical protein
MNTINAPILNNQFEPAYRDYPQRTMPIVLEFARPVLESDCHVLRYFQVPDDRQAQATEAGQYIQATVSIAPGSFVLGCQQKNSDGIGFLIQLTDQATGHALFSQPMPTQFLFRDQTYMFPCPMPVLAPGLLLVEIWAQQAGECSLVLVVAEYDADLAMRKGCINGR